MKYLVVNADDFGADVYRNQGIAERWRQGLIREGCQVAVLTTRDVDLSEIGQAVARFRPKESNRATASLSILIHCGKVPFPIYVFVQGVQDIYGLPL